MTLKIEENNVFMQTARRVWVNGRVFDLQNALPLNEVVETAGLIMVLGEQDDILSGITIPRR
ncbi:MAG: EscD/YscD/HrpQ family type III secretion system inner membrane ring protein, partial [Candidatus Regiella insecticola]|nr:EscD/YscD/HrpQ family type III secretion system inner membrane ring protein [Candidatus Regiella insecticola]